MPAALAIPCTSCQAALEVDAEHAGWKVRCPKCGAVFVARSGATPTDGSYSPSPYAQTWTPPQPQQPWAGAASPPPALSGMAPVAPPPVAPGPAIPSPAAPPPPGSFQEIFASPVPGAPGAPMANGAKGAFVLGVLSLVLVHFLGIFAILAGYKARKRVRDSGGQLAGDNLALAGILIGAIGLLLFFVDGWSPFGFFGKMRAPFSWHSGR